MKIIILLYYIKIIFPMKKNKVEKIVKEIMRKCNKVTNIHILEYRSLINENEFDEEDKYSSVIRKNNNDNQK